jgi:hypothetical protein
MSFDWRSWLQKHAAQVSDRSVRFRMHMWGGAVLVAVAEFALAGVALIHGSPALAVLCVTLAAVFSAIAWYCRIVASQ